MILNGKECADFLYTTAIPNILKTTISDPSTPTLLILSVGNDPASQIYMRNKRKAAERLNFNYKYFNFPEDTSESTIADTIQEMNANPTIDGIILQLPLPASYSKDTVTFLQGLIAPDKDVDGFLGEKSFFTPCTPLGIINLLEYNKIPIDGTNVTIIGRSNIVGKPLAKLLTDLNATVTLAHTHTKSLKTVCADADIIVCATGHKDTITPAVLPSNSSNVTLIDVGMNKTETGKLIGDINHDCYPLVANYSPTPGGTGPMTVAALMMNVALAHMLHFNHELTHKIKNKTQENKIQAQKALIENLKKI